MNIRWKVAFYGGLGSGISSLLMGEQMYLPMESGVGEGFLGVDEGLRWLEQALCRYSFVEGTRSPKPCVYSVLGGSSGKDETLYSFLPSL